MAKVNRFRAVIEEFANAAAELREIFGEVVVTRIEGMNRAAQGSAHHEVAGNGAAVFKQDADGAGSVPGRVQNGGGKAEFGERIALFDEQIGLDGGKSRVEKEREDSARKSQGDERARIAGAHFGSVGSVDRSGHAQALLEGKSAASVIRVSMGVQEESEALRLEVKRRMPRRILSSSPADPVSTKTARSPTRT